MKKRKIVIFVLAMAVIMSLGSSLIYAENTATPYAEICESCGIGAMREIIQKEYLEVARESCNCAVPQKNNMHITVDIFNKTYLKCTRCNYLVFMGSSYYETEVQCRYDSTRTTNLEVGFDETKEIVFTEETDQIIATSIIEDMDGEGNSAAVVMVETGENSTEFSKDEISKIMNDTINDVIDHGNDTFGLDQCPNGLNGRHKYKSTSIVIYIHLLQPIPSRYCDALGQPYYQCEYCGDGYAEKPGADLGAHIKGTQYGCPY